MMSELSRHTLNRLQIQLYEEFIMERTKLSRLMCLLCAAAILFSAAACKSSPETSSSESDADSNISSDYQSEENSSVSSDEEQSSSAPSSSNASTTSKPSSQSEKTTNLTREQVMAQMPAKLKNTTIKYMTWENPIFHSHHKYFRKFQSLCTM